MMATLLVENAGQLITGQGAPGNPLGILHGASVAIRDGLIAAVGPAREIRRRFGRAPEAGAALEAIDAGGRVVMPGLVDCHTHLIFAGWRREESDERLAGRSYLDILQSGGGILSSVRATRAASGEDLRRRAAATLAEMLEQGTTTVEAKSGYGLDLDTELRSLEAVARLNQEGPVQLIPTFLGAHAVPPEYAGRPDAYVDFLVQRALPVVASRGLARFCDVFCEEGVFTVAQSERLLRAAHRLGLGLKIHADELAETGGASLAAKLRAVSADHLTHTGPSGREALAKAGVVAVVLPATSFFLRSAWAPLPELLATGVRVALATDFNPGTSPVTSLWFVLQVASHYWSLPAGTVLPMVTWQAAHAVGEAERLGKLAPGMQADLLVLATDDYRDVVYRLGWNPVAVAIKRGRVVMKREPPFRPA